MTLIQGPAHDLPADGSCATNDQKLHAERVRFRSGLSLGVHAHEPRKLSRRLNP